MTKELNKLTDCIRYGETEEDRIVAYEEIVYRNEFPSIRCNERLVTSSKNGVIEDVTIKVKGDQA